MELQALHRNSILRCATSTRRLASSASHQPVLAAKHLRQVETYAVNEGVEWVILTSGVVWQVYHITGGLPIVVDLALEVDLLGDETLTQKAN